MRSEFLPRFRVNNARNSARGGEVETRRENSVFWAAEKKIMNEVARLGHMRIVLIEDDPESRASLQMLLEEEGADVIAVADAEDGAQAAIGILPDAVICDLDFPRWTVFI